MTHLEDAFGGLISGPPKLWKHGEIYVHEFAKQYPKPGPMVITNFQMSPIHWNNGISNPCVDRVVYIGGEKIPRSPFELEQFDQMHDSGHSRNLESDSPEFITVAFGFLKIDCSKTKDQTQSGYLTILSSAVHGGNILGRVFSITGSFTNDTFPILKPQRAASSTTRSASAELTHGYNVDRDDTSIYATDSPGAFTSLTLTEIGSLIEKRGNGDPLHYQILTMIGLLPVLCWIIFSIRLSQVEIVMHVEVDGNKHRSSASSLLSSSSPSGRSGNSASPAKASSGGSITSGNTSTSSTGILHRRPNSNATTRHHTQRQKSALEFKLREIHYTKFIDDRMIGSLWFSPLMHVGYIAALTWCWCIRLEDTGNVIHSFLPRFAHFRLNYVGMIALLGSQEVCSWVLSLTTTLLSRHSSRCSMMMQEHRQQALIYAYQFSPIRHVLKMTNVIACLVLIASVLVFEEQSSDDNLFVDTQKLLMLCAFSCFTSEAWLIVQGLMMKSPSSAFRKTGEPMMSDDHERSPKPPHWCQVGSLTRGFSISTRGISNYLVSQDFMEKSSSSSHAWKNDDVSRLCFSGKIADALMLGRSDLMLQGFFNGKNVQLELLEAPLRDQIMDTTIVNAGGQQFVLHRHWIYHGRSNFTCS